jgi:hypothetical protein
MGAIDIFFVFNKMWFLPIVDLDLPLVIASFTWLTCLATTFRAPRLKPEFFRPLCPDGLVFHRNRTPAIRKWAATTECERG